MNIKKTHTTLLMFAAVLLSSFRLPVATSGKVFYEISYPDLPAELKGQEANMPNNAAVYFKNEFSRNELSITGGKMIIIANSLTKEILLCINALGKKLAVKKTAADIEKDMLSQGKLPDVKIVATDEVKEIAGYTCKKAILKVGVGDSLVASDCWYTLDLPKIQTGSAIDNLYKDIKGFMMEYTVNQGVVKMKMRVRKVVIEEQPDALFKLPVGYKLLTEEELDKELGQ